MWGEDIPGKVVHDNFVAGMFHNIQVALEKDREIKLLEELIEEEVMRLGILISEPLQPLLMPRYTPLTTCS
jgi:hypothetical protein